MLSSRIGLTAFCLLPLVLAQDSTNSAVVNSTAAPTNTASSTNTTSTAAEPATASPATASGTSGTTAQTFPAPTVSGTQCGTAQQNFNQCVTKVAKDVSSCATTDNVCLCQTYANLAACYNACADLEPTGASYKQQSTQYCATAGVSVNTTSSTNTTTSAGNKTTSSVPVSRNSGTNSTTSTTNTSSASPSKASTFAASSGATMHGSSVIAVLASLAGACAAVLA